MKNALVLGAGGFIRSRLFNRPKKIFVVSRC